MGECQPLRFATWPTGCKARRREFKSGSGVGGFLGFLAWGEINFVLDGFLVPAGAKKHAAAILDHVGVATKVGGCILGGEPPNVHIFPDQVVSATLFAFPLRIFPGAADRWNVLQPRRFGCDLLQFVAVAELGGAAGPLNAKEPVLTGHRSATLFPIGIDRANVTGIGSHAGNCGQQEMIFSSAAEVESEASFGESAHEERRALVHGVEKGSKFTIRDALNEELEILLVRRGANRISALDTLAIDFDAESGVLAG